MHLSIQSLQKMKKSFNKCVTYQRNMFQYHRKTLLFHHMDWDTFGLPLATGIYRDFKTEDQNLMWKRVKRFQQIWLGRESYLSGIVSVSHFSLQCFDGRSNYAIEMAPTASQNIFYPVNLVLVLSLTGKTYKPTPSQVWSVLFYMHCEYCTYGNSVWRYSNIPE